MTVANVLYLEECMRAYRRKEGSEPRSLQSCISKNFQMNRHADSGLFISISIKTYNKNIQNDAFSDSSESFPGILPCLGSYSIIAFV